MKLKSIWPVFSAIMLVVIYFSVFYLIGKKERDDFCKNEINSKITSCSNPQKKVVEYYLPNNLQIDVSVVDEIDIKVGDSISKKKQTSEYSVYKKNEKGKYYFFKLYDIEKSRNQITN